MSNNQKPEKLNLRVFAPASIIIFSLVLFAFVAPKTAESFFMHMQQSIVMNASWVYVLAVAVILLVVVYLMFSSLGDIRLGPDHSSPDYSMGSWISMLFAAGMGIGLMFFGVSEPLMHYLAPPSADPRSLEAAREAMKITFFHWGFHAWGIYALVALILAYFSFRHKLPLTLRSAFYPIIGDKIYGPAGHAIDVFAVVGTIFGVATSLGLGAAQVNSGLSHLFDIEVNNINQVMLMIGITSLAVVSVATGLDKGIKILSETNMVLAIILLLLIFILGPTVFLLQAYLQNLGAYLSDLVSLTLNLYAYEQTEWFGGWTIFYWGWWLAWAPFVGLFIARISRGRTIREFLFGVLLVPTLFTLFWMTVFGNSAIDGVMNHGVERLADLVTEDVSQALFVFLEQYPLTNILRMIAVLMLVVFFVTSCDSGAMVVDMLCSNGRNDTPLWQRVYWAVSVGVVAAVLLLAGGLNALQTMTIASALPFAIVLLFAIVGFFRAMAIERSKRESLMMEDIPFNPVSKEDGWKMRLGSVVTFPDKSSVDKFISSDVKVALEKVVNELNQYEVKASLEEHKRGFRLLANHGEERDFVYAVYRSSHAQPIFFDDDQDEDDVFYRAEVHLSEGGQGYDIMGWSEQAILNDVVRQYHKHMHFIHAVR